MAIVPDARSLPSGGLGAGAASGAPQATSPSKPAGAIDILYSGLHFLYEAATLVRGRRCPLDPPFFHGCPFGILGDEWASGAHTGADLYKTPSSVAVEDSCGFNGTGVAGANVYPPFAGCSHQTTPNKAKVIAAANMGAGIGNCVILEHMNSAHAIQVRTVYMHLDSIAVSVGQFVSTTDVIGTVGYSGGYSSTNAHLHFELWAKQSSHPSWRVAAEVLPDTIQAARPGAIDPAIWLPNCVPSDEISIAQLWYPHARFPVVGGESIEFFFDGDPFVKVWGPVGGALEVYPFIDGPDEMARVLYAQSVGPGTMALVLLHDISGSLALITAYELGGDAITFPVVPGDWVGLNTKIADIAAGGEDPNVNIFVFQVPVVVGSSVDYTSFSFIWWEASGYQVRPTVYYDFSNAGLPFI